MKILHAALAAAALAAALAGAWWLQNRSGAAGALAGASSGPAEPRGTASGASGGPSAAPGGRGFGGPAAGGPAAVEVAGVERVRLEDDALAVGSLRSNQGIVVRPEVSGRVAALGFADGQRIKRGQVLLRLDDTLQLAQLKQAEAQASIARTNLQRSRELVAQGFVSQSAVDQNAAALEVAQAQVALAQAQLARMTITAPFDGVAGIRSVNVGDYVKDGADVVGLEDISSLWVDFRLPERYVSRLRVGQPVELALDALPGRRFEAKVGALDAVLDANGRSVLVRARLANPDGVLRGGMFARVRVVFAVRENALVVPEAALVPMGEKQYVVKVVDDAGGGKVGRRVEARVGQRLPGRAELLAGVAEGEVVVIAGHARLMRGEPQPVRVVSERSGAGGPVSGPRGSASGASGGASGAAGGSARSAASAT